MSESRCIGSEVNAASPDATGPSGVAFNRPFVAGNESRYMQEVMRNGHLAGDGVFTKRCSRLLEDKLGVSKVFLTTSCTHALEMAAMLLDIRPGDEVVVPSFTFVSSANAFVLRGAKIVFADIRPDTLNLDESKLRKLVTNRTKAIVAVHYAGVGCNMDAICRTAEKHGVSVVEDCAHALPARFKGKSLGSFGALATLSFHETKNFTCGEGGALVVNDERMVRRAEILREKGTDRSAFFRKEVSCYSWRDIGSSYLPSELLAAFLFAQLEKMEFVQQKRKNLWGNYFNSLSSWASASGIVLPFVPRECGQPYHIFYLLMPSFRLRQAFVAHLAKHGISARSHFVPLHRSPMARRAGAMDNSCPVACDASSRLVRLPLFTGMTDREQARVIVAAIGFEV